MSIFTGAGVAIITPMTETGAVNYPKLEEILEYQIANGTDATLSVERPVSHLPMSHEEHLEATRFTAEKVAGRTRLSQVPVLIVQRPLSIFLRKQKNTVWTAFSW